MTRHDRLGKYELLTKLATGGMAEVYLARERGLAGMERFVVIKRILPHLAQHASFVEMFLREGRIIARLNHPNIVQIYELGAESERRYFLALEYIHGITLRELQVLANQRQSILPEEVVLGIGIQAAGGLDAAHSLCDTEDRPLGLVHRDVTPHNLMCMSTGLVKLLDFGIAKATQGQSEATYSGDLKGKFSYMSPEQALQRPLDARSDIFSLGIVLWESLTGRRLFKRASQLEMLQAISTGDVPSPRLWRPELSERCAQVVMKALAQRPEDRYPSALEFKRAMLELARAEQMNVSQDRVEEYVHSVASDRLDERTRALNEAVELDALSDDARHSLLHETSSGIFEGSLEVEEDLPTVVERPAGRITATNNGEGAPLQIEAVPYPHATEHAAPGEATEQVAPRAQLTRRKLAAGLVIFALLFAGAMLLLSQLPPSYDGPPVKLGWAPVVEPKLLEVEMKPLHELLSQELDQEVGFVVSTSYEALADELVSGEVDFAVLPPLLYIKTKARTPQIEALAIKEFDGSMASDGLLLVTQDIVAGDVEGLRGKTFCLTDHDSTTGNFLPRDYLRQQGVDPDEIIGEVVWSGDHLQVMRDLIEGKCQVGATHSGAFIAADRLGIPVSKLRNFATTGHVPQDVVCAGPRVTPAQKEAMRRVLLSFSPRDAFGEEYFGQTQRITGFEPAQESYYDSLRRALRATQAVKQ